MPDKNDKILQVDSITFGVTTASGKHKTLVYRFENPSVNQMVHVDVGGEPREFSLNFDFDSYFFEVKDESGETVTSLLACYDQEEIYENCTVQVWSNSQTGDVSIGYWRNGDE